MKSLDMFFTRNTATNNYRGTFDTNLLDEDFISFNKKLETVKKTEGVKRVRDNVRQTSEIM